MAKKTIKYSVDYKVNGAGKVEDSFQGIGNDLNTS